MTIGGADPKSELDASRIFISHVEEDAGVALQIADALEAAGYRTWCYERDALPGPSYLLQTATEVEHSAAVVLLISPSSLGSHQVTAEVVRAHESGRAFVPVLLGISHIEFAARQPEWREALGSATSIAVPAAGVGAILPRILQGLDGLGIRPAATPNVREPGQRTYVVPPAPPAPRSKRPPVLVAGAAAVVVLGLIGMGAVVTLGGGGGDERVTATTTPAASSTTVASLPEGGATSTPSNTAGPPSTTAAPTSGAPTTARPVVVPTAPPSPTTSPPAPPTVPTTSPPATPPGYASADDTALTTSAGRMEVLDAWLTSEWCSSDGSRCLTASGSDRYLAVTLVPADLGEAAAPAEANQSTVSFGAITAGAQVVALDAEMDMLEVVYGSLPASAADGDVLLSWPNNPILRLTVTT